MGAGVAESEPLPDHIEDRLAEFTELVATAISNTARPGGAGPARGRAGRAAARGDAGRPRGPAAGGVRRGRARGRPAPRCRRHAHGAVRARRHGDRRRAAGAAGRSHRSAHGCRSTGENVAATGRCGPGDRRGWTTTRSVPGLAAELGRELGIRSSVGAPIVVEGRLWGVMIAHSKRRPAPGGHRVEDRRVHGTRRDGDREHRGAGGGEPARGRAGRAAARGHAGGAASVAGRGLRGGRRGGRAAAARRGHDDVPLRGRREGDRRRGLG